MDTEISSCSSSSGIADQGFVTVSRYVRLYTVFEAATCYLHQHRQSHKFHISLYPWSPLSCTVHDFCTLIPRVIPSRRTRLHGHIPCARCFRSHFCLARTCVASWIEVWKSIACLGRQHHCAGKFISQPYVKHQCAFVSQRRPGALAGEYLLRSS